MVIPAIQNTPLIVAHAHIKITSMGVGVVHNRWVARIRHNTSVLNVNMDARAYCQWSTTARAYLFGLATAVGRTQSAIYQPVKRF